VTDQVTQRSLIANDILIWQALWTRP